MCGIVGTLDPVGSGASDRANVAAMLEAIGHRGPDAAAAYLDDGLTLGFVRLSIIDLEGGMQPLVNEDETIWLVCNGEVFNYVELRQELIGRGHRFRTGSDCETILHLYEELGPSCVERLNGQFAFALWDRKRRRLLLARDRLGVRPLFYVEEGGRLHFASEIKGLLANPAIPAEVDPLGLAQVFTFWSAVPPRTMFRGVSALPPGHLLTAESGRVNVTRYWRLRFDRSPPVRPADAADHLRDLLIDSVRLRLRADVPVAAYVSGGLDSAAIAMLARRFSGSRLQTFSVGFTDAHYDETQAQSRIAELLGTEHHTVAIGPADIARVLPDVVLHAETPLLRTAPAPMFILSDLVRRSGIKVVLTGEGADEFLLGYDIFFEAKIRALWAGNPGSHLRPRLLRSLYADIPAISGLPRPYLEATFGVGLEDPGALGFAHRVRWDSTRRLARFLAPEVRNLIPEAGAEVEELLADQREISDPVARAQQGEVTTFLAPYLLASQGDRVAMAHAVEGRFPFLDHRVVEFANSLPTAWKAPGLRAKHLLRRALVDLLPDEIRMRPKRPYRAPIHSVFGGDSAPDYVREMFDPAAVARHGMLEPERVARLRARLAGKDRLGEMDEMAVVGVLTTGLFMNAFCSGQAARRGSATRIEFVDRRLGRAAV